MTIEKGHPTLSTISSNQPHRPESSLQSTGSHSAGMDFRSLFTFAPADNTNMPLDQIIPNGGAVHTSRKTKPRFHIRYSNVAPMCLPNGWVLMGSHLPRVQFPFVSNTDCLLRLRLRTELAQPLEYAMIEADVYRDGFIQREHSYSDIDIRGRRVYVVLEYVENVQEFTMDGPPCYIRIVDWTYSDRRVWYRFQIVDKEHLVPRVDGAIATSSSPISQHAATPVQDFHLYQQCRQCGLTGHVEIRCPSTIYKKQDDVNDRLLWCGIANHEKVVYGVVPGCSCGK